MLKTSTKWSILVQPVHQTCNKNCRSLPALELTRSRKLEIGQKIIAWTMILNIYELCSYFLMIKSLHQPQPEIWLIKTEAFSKRSYKWPAAACDVTAIISAMAAMCKLKLYKYYSLSFLINVCYTGINTWLIIRVLGFCPRGGGGLGQNPP